MPRRYVFHDRIEDYLADELLLLALNAYLCNPTSFDLLFTSMFLNNFGKAVICLFGVSTLCSAGNINCEGSVECGDDGIDNAMGHIQTKLQAAIAAGDGGLHYGPHSMVLVLIISFETKLTITAAQIACDCNGEAGFPIPNAGVCAFFQKGASGTIKEVSGYVAHLQKHNCVNCGSYATNGKNINDGELTVNYVDMPHCCKAGIAGTHICHN